ncbi:MAG: hypothetical protein K0B81_03130 [Candidatus Cloacimonetes bacterium]|nr:hypothetical protein [Candidatus Cloacimonadota bacterium]
MTKILLILFGSMLILHSISLNAAERDLRPYRLINADRLYVDRIEDEYLTRLVGNVHFFYGDTEFFSDQAELYEVSKIARMFGNVKVIDDSLTIYSDIVDYYRLKEELILTGNVLILEEHEDGTERTFQSDKGEYLRNERQIYAYDNILFYDQRESIYGYCHYLDYNIESGYGLITNNPEIKVEGDESLTITAEKIEFYKDFNRLAATFNVNTIYDDYLVTSDFLLFFIDDEYAVFLGEPRFTSDIAEAVAEEFYLYFEDRKIKSATLENNCLTFFATKEGAEKKSSVKCNLMELQFSEGKITEMQAFYNVISNYVSESSDRDQIINYAESEELVVTFNDENEIESVKFLGKVSGRYKFSDKVIDRTE